MIFLFDKHFKIDFYKVWYMLGWVNYSKGESSYPTAKYYFKKANEVIDFIEI